MMETCQNQAYFLSPHYSAPWQHAGASRKAALVAARAQADHAALTALVAKVTAWRAD
jgi:hypothetical protein